MVVRRSLLVTSNEEQSAGICQVTVLVLEILEGPSAFFVLANHSSIMIPMVISIEKETTWPAWPGLRIFSQLGKKSTRNSTVPGVYCPTDLTRLSVISELEYNLI